MLTLLAATALLLTAADHWTTYLCLRQPVAGFEVSEANPLSAWLFEQLGLVGGLALDSAVTLAAVAFLLRTRLVPHTAKALYLGLVIVATGLAVTNNLGAVEALALPLAGR